ncbi:MAG: Putative regulatory protein [uncultured Nocardioidaceae bacterium]|uniref:Regulatory protein n=1 Tax=uncultured Nocardioidaceae bacterium TaxID=253824 RepID=A0A6J4N2U7_9ACTN|nr:MAG: Putative regulatory protein [uncultured Nocardioidaceae bacterium]
MLDSPALRDGEPEVLSGADRLDARVRWVHVGEVREIAGLLQGGELVLSTGLAMRGPAADSVAYLDDLVGSRAAGLVVELGEEFPAVPSEVVAAARGAGFPLVALHRRVRFVEVTEQVHRSIVAEQLEQVEHARQVHETFTQLSLESAESATIVTTAAALCGSSVVLEDLSRHVVAFEARGRPAASLLADWERRSRSAPVLDNAGITGPEGWMTAPAGLPGDRWGRLVVPDPYADQARLSMVLERAAQALELGRMVERERFGLALQAHSGMLADLSSGQILDEPSARARATALGLTPSSAYVAVVAVHRAAGAHRGPDPHRSRELVEHLSAALRGARLTGLVGTLTGRQVGLLLAVPKGRTDEQALDALADRLAGLPTAEQVVVGAGPVSPGIVTAGAGFRQAAHVADVAAAMPTPGDRRWFRASHVRLRGLLALLHDDPRVQGFVEAELGPLLEHEARTGAGLLDLLRQYVAAGGNKTRLAQATHRSRPALYKKLERLERILGVDLDEPMSLMSLGVAVTAYDQVRPDLGG